MSFNEIIGDYSKNINALCGKMPLLNVTKSGAYSYQWVNNSYCGCLVKDTVYSGSRWVA